MIIAKTFGGLFLVLNEKHVCRIDGYTYFQSIEELVKVYVTCSTIFNEILIEDVYKLLIDKTVCEFSSKNNLKEQYPEYFI